MTELKTDRPKLYLGTAQLGGPYGVVGGPNGPSAEEVLRILDVAEARFAGIDTARAYPGSEDRIGEWWSGRRDRRAPLRLITKTPKRTGHADADPEGFVLRRWAESLKALQGAQPQAVMLHDSTDFLHPAVQQDLRALRDQGVLTGISVYDPAQLRSALDLPGLGIVQVPMNLLDRRFLDENVLDICAERGVEVHLRSLFLQGVLLADPAGLPERVGTLAPAATVLHKRAQALGVPAAALCLRIAWCHSGIGGVVLGAETAQQAEELAEAHRIAGRIDGPLEPLLRELDRVTPKGAADPRNWS